MSAQPSHFLARHPRAARMLVLLVVSVGWLLGPKPVAPSDYCGHRIEFTAWAGLTVNCDSGGFAGLAAEPRTILDRTNLRQTRPVFSLIGTVMGWPLAQLTHAFKPGLDPRAGYFLGYILLNFLLLAAAVELLALLLAGVGATAAEILGLSLFLVANDLTKAFLWTAHSQLFGLLCPLLTIALCVWLAAAERSRRQLAVLGLALSLAILTYGTFFVTVAALLLADFHRGWERRQPLPQAVARAVALALPALLPVALWPAWVKQTTGAFYSHELVAYRQFVWLADAFQAGGVRGLAIVGTKARLFADTWLTAELAPLTLATAALVVLTRRAPVETPARELRRQTWLWLLLGLVFLALMGFYATRLTYNLVPAMLILAGLALTQLPAARRRLAARLLPIAGLAWWLAHAVKHGPYS